MSAIENKLNQVLNNYSESFSNKIYSDENEESDVLMEVFGITQVLKSENKQYWGRELGKCWENLLRGIFEMTHQDFQPPKKFGKDEPADFFCGLDAIDTKYRVGSGDSGTLKKFESYGKLLQAEGYRPILLFLRTDNLPSALTKIDAGGWTKYMGDESFEYIKAKTGFDLKNWLIALNTRGTFKINRK